MLEMRWYTRQHATSTGQQEVLQYRQQIDVTVRAGGAGTWDSEVMARTANWQWSEWQDVPRVVEVDPSCP